MTKKAKKRRGNPAIAKAGERTRFRPGVCPNPGGRPRTASFSDAIREVAAMAVRQLRTLKGDSIAVATAKALAKQALKGRVTAISEMIDRSEGKARQGVDLAHSGPVQINVEYEEPLLIPKDSEPAPAKPLSLADVLMQIAQETEDETTLQAIAALAVLLKDKRGNSDGEKQETKPS